MNRSLFSASMVLVLMGTNLILTAQPRIREDDHFWRKRVVNRISLVEKINQPLVHHESNYYSGNSRYTQTQGMVMALIEGVKQGKYVAYDPDDWTNFYQYEALVQKMREFEDALVPANDGWEDAPSDPFTESIDDGWGAAPQPQEWNVGANDTWGSPFEQGQDTQSVPDYQALPDLAPYEQVIHVVEDYVFDKNRSEFTQRIDFFEVIWVDPASTLPEKVLARFRWEEVADLLDETMWKSRFNDAESRSVREVFDLRIFHSFPIQVGGEPVRTLLEAEKRRQEMIEFEHHLWNF